MAADGTGMPVFVRVLGEVAIAHDGIALPLPESLRAVALLRWLAVHAGSRTRSEIASSRWPDVPYAVRRRVDVADSPLRFLEWWTGIESTTVGGDGDYTMYVDGYPDFPMPQTLDASRDNGSVKISCMVSDLVFQWHLEPVEGARKYLCTWTFPKARPPASTCSATPSPQRCASSARWRPPAPADVLSRSRTTSRIARSTVRCRPSRPGRPRLRSDRTAAFRPSRVSP